MSILLSFFKSLYLSFYSRDFYRSVLSERRGVGFCHLAALLLLCTLFIPLRLPSAIDDLVEGVLPPLIEQFPPIEIADGRLTLGVDSPYFIDDPNTGEHLIAFDTSSSLNSLEEAASHILVVGDSIVFEAFGEEQSLPLSRIGSIELDREGVREWAELFRGWAKYSLTLKIWVVFYLFSFVSAFVFILLYSLFALLYAAIRDLKRSYSQFLRLSVFACTPMILLSGFFGIGSASWSGWFVSFVLAIFYCGFAVNANIKS